MSGVSLVKDETVTRFSDSRYFSGFDAHEMRIELSGNYVRHNPALEMDSAEAYNLNQRKPLVFL